jgi:acyl carrier protein
MQTVTDSILLTLKELIQTRMKHHVGSTLLKNETPLFEGGLNLDSFGALELVSLTEEHFRIEYEEEDLTENNFKTVLTLADLLRRRTARESLTNKG